MIDKIFGGGLATLIEKIVGTFKLSPAAKMEFERELIANKHELDLKEAEFDSKILDIQGREIDAARDVVKAEMATGDKYTTRARPTFVYVILGMLVHNYVVVPYTGRPPIEFPAELFDVMTMILLGIVGGRTLEKVMKWKGQSK